jgi:hypothetical protein
VNSQCLRPKVGSHIQEECSKIMSFIGVISKSLINLESFFEL